MADADPNPALSVQAVGVAGDLHVLYLDDRGRLHHKIRISDGDWSAWGKIALPGTRVTAFSAAGVGDELHLVAVTELELWYHTIRLSDGSWQALTQLPDQPLLGE